MKRSELQTQFHKEKGTEAFNSKGEPEIDYVQWLEDSLTKSCEVEEKPAGRKRFMEITATKSTTGILNMNLKYEGFNSYEALGVVELAKNEVLQEIIKGRNEK